MKISSIERIIGLVTQQNKVSGLQKAAVDCRDVLSSTSFEDTVEMELGQLISPFEDEFYLFHFALQKDSNREIEVGGGRSGGLLKGVKQVLLEQRG